MANLRTNNLSGEQGQNAYRGSVQFLGGNDALVVPASSDFAYGTGDFTIEAWIWKAGIPTVGESRGIFTQTQAGNDYIVFKIGSTNVIEATFGSTTISTTGKLAVRSWNHVAVSRSSNTVKVFLNGIASSGSTVSTDFSDTTRNPTIGNYTHSYGSLDYNGFISNFRVTKGEALYTTDFTPPTTELTADANTVLLCCQNSDDPTQEETGKTITASGSLATAGYNKTQPKVIPPYGVDAGNTFGGPIQQSSQGYMCFPTGRTEERGRGRGVLFGGYHPSSGPAGIDEIHYLDIQSMGNAVRFGDLSISSYSGSTTCASSTRALKAGGAIGPGSANPNKTNNIEFVTIITQGNSIDFGDMLDAISFNPGGGNQTRGIWMGGEAPGAPGSAAVNTIQFVTIANLGNAQDFGDLRDTAVIPAIGASPTRILAMGGKGGNPSSFQAYIDFVEIATTGNAQDFGDMSTARNQNTGVSSNTRAVAMGGNSGSGLVNVMEFVTIATLGDATDFGDLSSGTEHTGSVNNATRGVQTGGRFPAYVNTMEFITIATTGNSLDFGDIPKASLAYVAGASDSHGGLS